MEEFSEILGKKSVVEYISLLSVLTLLSSIIYLISFSHEFKFDFISFCSIQDYFKLVVIWLPRVVITFLFFGFVNVLLHTVNQKKDKRWIKVLSIVFSWLVFVGLAYSGFIELLKPISHVENESLSFVNLEGSDIISFFVLCIASLCGLLLLIYFKAADHLAIGLPLLILFIGLPLIQGRSDAKLHIKGLNPIILELKDSMNSKISGELLMVTTDYIFLMREDDSKIFSVPSQSIHLLYTK